MRAPSPTLDTQQLTAQQAVRAHKSGRIGARFESFGVRCAGAAASTNSGCVRAPAAKSQELPQIMHRRPVD